MMITVYTWDAQRIYIDSAEVDPKGAMPPRSTLKHPPELTPPQVARWTGSDWEVLPERPVPPTPEPTPEPVPQSVTMRQARLALLGAGKLADVDTAIAGLPEPERTAAQIEWEYSQEVHRDRPFVAMLAPALGLSEEALDDLFRVAATL